MLERLARWLRVLGLDVVSAAGAGAVGVGGVGETDAALARRAVGEGRVLLTRDRRLPRDQPACPCFVVRSGTPLQQLAEVLAHFAIEPPSDPAALFTRCLLCNVP